MTDQITLIWSDKKAITHVLVPIAWVCKWADDVAQFRREVAVITGMQSALGALIYDQLDDAGMCVGLKYEGQVYKRSDDLRLPPIPDPPPDPVDL